MTVVRVVGCGTPSAADDAAGLIAARMAGEELAGVPGVEVVEAGGPFHVLDLLEGAHAVVLVDAVRAPGGGRPPGTVVRVEAGPEGLPADVGRSVSSHGFGVGEAVGLAAALRPGHRIVFLGVEAENVAAGWPVSAPVRRALPGLAHRVAEEARRLVEGAPPGEDGEEA
ncbi:MAG: hydrogenase maturation protease [Actinobacteria bacterium]|nr:hydrogenase maturation protease [Actinomycetota bacterium]